MIEALLLAAASAFLQAPQASTQRQADPPPIVVTADRIRDYRAALRACLARNCPTNEDIDATLALAEALFVSGDYDDARFVVQSSLRRNRGAASAFPEPVSDLYRTHARISSHLGLDDDARTSTFGILRALEAGIPVADHRHLRARMEIANYFMRRGEANQARQELSRLVRAAQAARDEETALFAELKLLWFEDAIERNGPARRRLVAMSQDTSEANRRRAFGARLLLARIYREEGDIGRADALVEEMNRSAGGTRRDLIHAPAYELQVQPVGSRAFGSRDDPGMRMADAGPPVESATGPSDGGGVSSAATDIAVMGNTLNRVSDTFEDTWIDVGFWVLPGGRVADVQIVRQDSRAGWAAPLLESIRGRIYTAAPQATYRLERYTYTAGYEQVTGSRLPRRSMAARAEYFDLSEGATPPGPPPGEPAGVPVDGRPAD